MLDANDEVMAGSGWDDAVLDPICDDRGKIVPEDVDIRAARQALPMSDTGRAEVRLIRVREVFCVDFVTQIMSAA